MWRLSSVIKSLVCWYCLLIFESQECITSKHPKLVCIRVPGESYREGLRSLLLCLCDVFRALANSLVSWYCSFKGAPHLNTQKTRSDDVQGNTRVRTTCRYGLLPSRSIPYKAVGHRPMNMLMRFLSCRSRLCVSVKSIQNVGYAASVVAALVQIIHAWQQIARVKIFSFLRYWQQRRWHAWLHLGTVYGQLFIWNEVWVRADCGLLPRFNACRTYHDAYLCVNRGYKGWCCIALSPRPLHPSSFHPTPPPKTPNKQTKKKHAKKHACSWDYFPHISVSSKS